MSGKILKVCVIVILMTLSGACAEAQTIDPCDDLISAETSGAWQGYLLTLFREKPDPIEVKRIGDADFYFTKQPGRFANVSCSDNAVEWQEMYPIGTLLQPLGLVDLEAMPHFQSFAEQEGLPVLVLTEFGHRKIVPFEALAPLTPNLTYLFADQYEPTMICRRAEGCVGHLAEVCGDLCTQELSALYGYAAVPSDNMTFRDARDAYFAIKGADEMLPPPFETKVETARHYTPLCIPFSIQTFAVGGTRHYPDSPDPSYMTLCARPAEGDDPPAVGTVKMVDLTYARSRFAGLLSGSFHRRFGSSLPELPAFQSRIEKRCGEKIADTASVEIEFALGFDIRKIAALSGNVVAQRSWTSTMMVPAEEYFLMLTYFMDSPFSLENDEGRSLKVFRIAIKAECVGTDIATAKSIDIYYEGPGERSNIVTIIASDGEGLVNQYLKDNGTIGFKASTIVNGVRRGYFWRIPDHTAYYLWRDQLRRFLIEGGVHDLPDELRALDPDDRVLMRDFFVHLILAAAFSYKDPCELRSVQCKRP
jgi:hypothetical protein